MMKYKEYVATVEFDDSVDLFHGAVINAAPYPIVTFEASDVEGLKREFQISIEEYFAVCEEYELEPLPPIPRVEHSLGCGTLSPCGECRRQQ